MRQKSEANKTASEQVVNRFLHCSSFLGFIWFNELEMITSVDNFDCSPGGAERAIA